MKKIQKSEFKYLFLSILSISLLLFLINNEKIRSQISNLNPIFQFLLLNIGIYFVFFFFIKSLSLNKSIKPIIKGSLGSILGFIALDLVLPEYHVTTSGLSVGGVFGASASDYFFGYIYQTFLGASGLFLVILTYIITFSILFFSGAYLIKNFVKSL